MNDFKKTTENAMNRYYQRLAENQFKKSGTQAITPAVSTLPKTEKKLELAEDKVSNKKENKGGFFGALGYLFHRGLLQSFQLTEDMFEGVARWGAQLVGKEEWAEKTKNSTWFDYDSAEKWYNPSDDNFAKNMFDFNDYVSKKFNEGLGKSVEGTADYLVGLGAEAVGEHKTAERLMLNDATNLYADKQYADAGKGTKFVGDVAQGIGNMLPSIALNAIPGVGPILSKANFAISAGGQATSEKAQENGKLGFGEWGYGTTMGALEGAIEAASGGTGKYLGKATGKVFGKQLAKSTAGKIATNVIGEGLEEVASDLADPLVQKAFGVTDKDLGEMYSETKKGLPKTFAVGAVTGGVMGGASTAMQAKAVGGVKNLNAIENASEFNNALSENNVRQEKGKSAAYSQRYITNEQRRVSETLKKADDETRAKIFKQAPRLKLYFNNDGSVKGTQAQEKTAEQRSPSGSFSTAPMRASIKNIDGKDIVVVDTDQDIFDGKEKSDYPQIVRRYMLDKFSDQVFPVGESKTFVSRPAIKEYVYPVNRRMGENIKSSKMRAGTELDNLLQVSEYMGRVSDDGRHPDAVRGWDKYKTRFVVDGRMFEGEVSIKLTARGDGFYDITKIKDITSGTNGNDLLSSQSASKQGDVVDSTLAKGKEDNLNANSNKVQSEDKSSTPIIRKSEKKVNTLEEKSLEKVNRPTSSASIKGRENDLVYTPSSEVRSDIAETIKDVMLISDGSIDYVVTDDLGDSNGFYDPDSGIMYLSNNAEIEGLRSFVVGHEYTHSLEGTKEYTALANAILKRISEYKELSKKYDIQDYAVRYVLDAEKSGKKYSEEQYKYIAQTELVADFVGKEMLSNEATIKRIESRNKGIVSKLLQWVKDKISILKSKKGTERDTLKFLLKAEKMLSNAIGASVGGFNVTEIEDGDNEDTNENNRYSLKTFNNDATVIDNNIKTVAGMKSIINLKGDEFPLSSGTIIDDVFAFYSTLNKTAYNDELGDVELTRRGVKDSFSHGIGDKKAAAFKAVPDIIREGRVVDYQENWKNRGYDTAVIAAPITISNDEYYALVVVRRTKTNQRFYLHEIDIKKRQAVLTEATTNKMSQELGGLPINSIFDKIRKVNTFKEKSLEKNVNIRKSLKIEPDYKLLDTYNEKQYNAFGWARVNGVLSKNENADFVSKYRRIKLGLQREVHKTVNGEIIVAVNDGTDNAFGINNVLVYAKGSFENYKITKVVRLNCYDETNLEVEREFIYEYEKNKYSQTRYALEDIYGEENIVQYDREDFPDYRESKTRARRRASGDVSGEDNGNNQVEQDRRRNLVEDREDKGLNARKSIKQIRYMPYSKIGYSNIEKIRRKVWNLYSGIESGVADGIAINIDNSIYVLDTSKDDGEVRFAVRKVLIADDESLAMEVIRRINNDAISKRYISDGLSSRLRGEYDNSSGSRLQRKSGEKLSDNQGKPQHNEVEVSTENGVGGGRTLTTRKSLKVRDNPNLSQTTTVQGEKDKTLKEKIEEIKKSSKSLALSVRSEMVDAQAPIVDFFKDMGDAQKGEALVQMARSAKAGGVARLTVSQFSADYSKEVGQSLAKILSPILDKENKEYTEDFYGYVLVQRHIDAIKFYEKTQSDIANLGRLKNANGESIIDIERKYGKKLEKETDKLLKQGLDEDEYNRRLKEIEDRLSQEERTEIERFTVGVGKQRRKVGAEYLKLIAYEIQPVFKFKDGSGYLSLDDAQAMVKEYEKENPEFIAVAERWWKYHQNLLQYQVDKGMMTKELMQELVDKYPHYVPANRKQDIEGFVINPEDTSVATVRGKVKGGSSLKGQIVTRNTIRKAVGSSLDFEDLQVSTSRQTISAYTNASVNDLLVAMYQEVEQKKPKKSKMLVVASEDMGKMAIDVEMAEAFAEENEGLGENEVVFYYEGKRYKAVVTKDIADAIKDLKNRGSGQTVIEGVLSKGMNLFKGLVTEYSPLFTVSNFIRDFQEAMVYTKNNRFKFVRNLFKAMRLMAKKSIEYRRFLALGGASSGLYSYDKGIYEKKSKNPIKWITKRISALNNFIEQSMRFNEYLLTVESGKSYETAILNSAEVTTNFSRSGTMGRRLNRALIPFLNASIQGSSKLWRTVFHKRTVAGWCKFVATSVALGLAVGLINDLISMFLNDDEEKEVYESLNRRDKENNYILVVGKTIIKVPKGRVLSAVGSIFDRGKDYFIDGDKKAFDEWGESMLQAITPVESMGRTIFAPIADVSTNTTWYGSEIESQKFDSVRPENRYDESTSAIAIGLGKMFKRSPKKIHYLIDQYSGVIGDVVLPLTTKKADTAGIFSRFVSDATYSNRYSNDFYDLLAETKYDKTDGDPIASLKYSYLNRIASSASDMYQKKRDIANSNIPDREKLEQTDIIQELLNSTFKSAIESAEVFETNALESGYLEALETLSKTTEYANLDEEEQKKVLTKLSNFYYAKVMSSITGEDYDVKYALYEKIGANKASLYLTEIDKITGDKDSKGVTINGSRKAKVEKYVNDLKLSAVQKYMLMVLAGYSLNESAKQKVISAISTMSISSDLKKALYELI